jgi:hypothetical protein
MSIRLHIDRLIVEGLPLSAQQARMLRAEIETRLAERFAAVAPDMRTGYTLDALSAVPVKWNASARNPGHGFADSLHAALTESRSITSTLTNSHA